jgi:multiple sugar transport system permease protein
MRKKRIQWAPYLLILPSLIFLAIFFAWPMFQALALSVWDSRGALTLREEPAADSPTIDRLPSESTVQILDRQGNFMTQEDLAATNLLTEDWYWVSGEGENGEVVEGWALNTRIRVREEADDGTPTAGTVRRVISTTADPNTTLYEEPNDNSPVVGQLEPNAAVDIIEVATLAIWFQIQGIGEHEDISGWVPSHTIQTFGDGETGRIRRGNAGVFTMSYIQRMLNDRFFLPALTTTLLLMVLILPVQFVLAIIMALVIQARLKGNNLFLYIFAIPLGVSDLAVGIVWYSIFTQGGYLNTILQQLGLIQFPLTFLAADTRHWIILAIFLAEVWRATSIVMVIVVSGLQAISDEVLEAAELFGATLWQRIRFVILPLLKPSLQVALILRTILALQVFAVVIALSGGDVVTVLARETFRQYYTLRNNNVAAAYAGLILLMSMVSAVIYLRLVRTQEEALE